MLNLTFLSNGIPGYMIFVINISIISFAFESQLCSQALDNEC